MSPGDNSSLHFANSLGLPSSKCTRTHAHTQAPRLVSQNLHTYVFTVVLQLSLSDRNFPDKKRSRRITDLHSGDGWNRRTRHCTALFHVQFSYLLLFLFGAEKPPVTCITHTHTRTHNTIVWQPQLQLFFYLAAAAFNTRPVSTATVLLTVRTAAVNAKPAPVRTWQPSYTRRTVNAAVDFFL